MMNGVYLECAVPDAAFPDVRFVQQQRADGGAAYIVHRAGRWQLTPNPGPGASVASRPSPDDSSREALLAEGAWKLKKGAAGTMRVVDASSLDAGTLNLLEAILAQLRAASQMAKEMPGHKPEVQLDPVTAVLSPGHCFGSTSEKHEAKLQEFVRKQVVRLGRGGPLFGANTFRRSSLCGHFATTLGTRVYHKSLMSVIRGT